MHAFVLALMLALRNLTRQFRRSLSALLSIGFGVAALLIAIGFNDAMFEEFREATIHSQYGHVQITRPGFHEKGRSDPYAYLLPHDAVARSVPLPAGATLAPRLLLNGLIAIDEVTLPFLSEGIDPAVDLVDDRSLRMVDGRRLAVGDERTVIVGQGLALQLGVSVGSSVVLLANSPEGHLGATDAEVVGIFSSVSKEFDDSALLMPISLSRNLAQVDGAHAWLVFLEDTRQTGQALDSLRERLAGQDYELQPWHVLADFFMRASELFDQQLQLVKGIVIAIILLGIGNTMMMNVMERTGEIGTVMALGVRRSAVLRGFLIEGALLGLIGALLGVVIALVAAMALGLMAIELPPPPGLARGYVAALLLAPSTVIEVVVVACVTTTIAALYPAYRASRMVIVDAIRSFR